MPTAVASITPVAAAEAGSTRWYRTPDHHQCSPTELWPDTFGGLPRGPPCWNPSRKSPEALVRPAGDHPEPSHRPRGSTAGMDGNRSPTRRAATRDSAKPQLPSAACLRRSSAPMRPSRARSRARWPGERAAAVDREAFSNWASSAMSWRTDRWRSSADSSRPGVVAVSPPSRCLTAVRGLVWIGMSAQEPGRIGAPFGLFAVARYRRSRGLLISVRDGDALPRRPAQESTGVLGGSFWIARNVCN
jgi:hypothetical protein